MLGEAAAALDAPGAGDLRLEEDEVASDREFEAHLHRFLQFASFDRRVQEQRGRYLKKGREPLAFLDAGDRKLERMGRGAHGVPAFSRTK